MIRVNRSRLILALVIFGVAFWLVLYWNMTYIYARHRLRPRKDILDLALDSPMSSNGEDEQEYSEAFLQRLGEIITADDQRNFDSGKTK